MVLGALALVPAVAAQTADLRWRPQPGQSVRYELHQTSKNERVDTPACGAGTGAAGETRTVESTIDQTLWLRFDAATDDGASPESRGTRVTMTVERVRMKITSEAARVEFDSAEASKGGPGGGGAATDPIAEALRAMAGTATTLTLDADGRVTAGEGGGPGLGLGSLLAGLDPGAGARLPADALGTITPGAGAPSRARVGQRWTSTSTLGGSLLGDAAMTTTHALRRLRAGVAEVEMQGSMTPTRERGASGDGLGGVFQVISASNKGEYRWDTVSGWLESLASRQTVRVQAEFLDERRIMESSSETRVQRLGAGEQDTRTNLPDR